jgi:NAD(P)-dependent dehydrogenase (short-subunit alcohol dehydrogenase family)
MKKILITGANTGLGKECARQLALRDGIEKIYLACRNNEKAEASKAELEKSTGKAIFEIILMDVSNLESVRRAVQALSEPVDALVMNAGGLGGTEFLQHTQDGVTQITASNLLGHVLLTDELLDQSKLTGTALYAGSEGARGAPKIGIPKPTLSSGSVEEFTSICDGSSFGPISDPMSPYCMVKLMGALWMASMARKHPDMRFVTVSPGHTGGTQVAEDMPAIKKFFFKNVGFTILPLFGLAHGLQDGCRRYVDVLTGDQYKSGVFYGSEAKVLTGPLVDQSAIFDAFNNEAFQDNADTAIHGFIH